MPTSQLLHDFAFSLAPIAAEFTALEGANWFKIVGVLLILMAIIVLQTGSYQKSAIRIATVFCLISATLFYFA
jgi:hypothetical protein